MNITGTHFNYYQICKRKLWLFANGISMEHTSDLVHEGKLIHEESYPQIFHIGSTDFGFVEFQEGQKFIPRLI